MQILIRNSQFTPLHRCAFYGYTRLASLLCLAGTNQMLQDESGQTAYERAVEQNNTEVAEILKPFFDSDGNNIAGKMVLRVKL